MARMTFYHKELLVNFIELNRGMVRSRSGGGGAGGEPAEVEEARRLWEEAATKLSEAGAVKRSGEEWKKAWGELLCRTKKMAKMYTRSRGSQKKLTPLDHRILAAGQGNLLLKNKGDDFAGNKYDSKPSSEVKSEVVFTEELPVEEYNDDDIPLRRLPDRTEPESRDALFNSSPSSSPLHNAKRKSSDFTSLEVSEIYPKWLIDIEKVRAQAELQRAEAAGRRADAAVKHSDAALIQAEAMLKLAEASSLQAEAIMRIARALESKGS